MERREIFQEGDIRESQSRSRLRQAEESKDFNYPEIPLDKIKFQLRIRVARNNQPRNKIESSRFSHTDPPLGGEVSLQGQNPFCKDSSLLNLSFNCRWERLGMTKWEQRTRSRPTIDC